MNQRIQSVYAQNSVDFGAEYKQAQTDLREIGGTISVQKPPTGTTSNNQTGENSELNALLNKYQNKN